MAGFSQCDKDTVSAHDGFLGNCFQHAINPSMPGRLYKDMEGFGQRILAKKLLLMVAKDEQDTIGFDIFIYQAVFPCLPSLGRCILLNSNDPAGTKPRRHIAQRTLFGFERDQCLGGTALAQKPRARRTVSGADGNILHRRDS